MTNQTEGVKDTHGIYNKIVTRPHLEELRKEYNTKAMQIEYPLTFDLRESISEIEYFTFEDYIMDVGSFLSIFCFVFYVLMSPARWLFVYSFITAIIKLIMRKYAEAEQMNLIEKMIKKFKLIQEAIEEKKNEPQFKGIYDNVTEMINVDLTTLTFDQIEDIHHQMKQLEKKLPDVSDLEGLIQTVRFQQPLAQKIMEEQIDSVIVERSKFSLAQVSELVRKRLSLVSIFQMYDDIELEHEKMNAELHIQNEKLRFLFNAIAEKERSRQVRQAVRDGKG